MNDLADGRVIFGSRSAGVGSCRSVAVRALADRSGLTGRGWAATARRGAVSTGARPGPGPDGHRGDDRRRWPGAAGPGDPAGPG